MRNRLVAVIDRLSDGGPIVQSVEYVYDSQNRWIAKSVDADGDGPQEAVDTYFVYDDDQIILQIDGEGGVTNRYLWGPAVDQILADEQVQQDGSTEVLWTLTDHLNTVRDLAVYDPETAVTTVVNHIVYDAYGQVTSQTDPTVTTLFGFTGRPFDSDTGLQNNLNRWYDAETGTWISEDPSGFRAGDANLYRYVGNEVTLAVDPTGTIIDLAGNSPAVQEKFAVLLMRLEQTPRGKKLVDTLRFSSTVVKIDVRMWAKLPVPSRALRAKLKTHAWAISDKSRNQEGLPIAIYVYTWPDRMNAKLFPIAVLAHELAHAEDMILGTINPAMDYPSGIKFSEIHACQVENDIREQLGLPVRTFYGIWRLPNWSLPPSAWRKPPRPDTWAIFLQVLSDAMSRTSPPLGF